MLPDAERLVEMAIRIALAVAVAFLIQRALFVVAGRIERVLRRAGPGEAEQRARTLGQIVRNVFTLVVVITTLVHVLGILGLDLRPVLAGAGIVGVALGFGAQTLVRDVIAGIFILAENQFAVGDLIEVNGRPATVEAITVRSTTLRDFHGYVHFVPNGELKTVVNRSRGWNRGVVDVALPADHEVERALEVCRAAAAAMSDDPAWRERLLEPIQVIGIESLTGPDLQVRFLVRTRPGADLPEASRALRLRAHRALADAGLPARLARAPLSVVPPPESQAAGSA